MFQSGQDEFGLHPTMNSPVGTSPRRETVEATAPTGQVAEGVLDQEALAEQRASEGRFAFQQFHRTYPARTLAAMSGSSTGTIAAWCDELHAVAGEAHVMQIVRVVVAISQHITLNGSVSQESPSHRSWEQSATRRP